MTQTHKFRGLALHTWTVDTTNLEGALAAAKAGGFDAVELRRVDFVRHPDALALVRKSGLPVACVGVEPGWIFSTKGEEQERLFGVFRESCQAAVALDCPTLMSAIGPGTASLDEVVANIRRAGVIATEFKLRLALEYQFQHPVVKSLDILLDLIAKAGEKSVGLLLDAQIFYVQFSDVPDAPPNGPPPVDRLPPGQGVVRWTDLFQLLAAKNYTGYLSYEAPNPAHWQRAAADVAGEGARATHRALAQAFDR